MLLMNSKSVESVANAFSSKNEVFPYLIKVYRTEFPFELLISLFEVHITIGCKSEGFHIYFI